MLRSRQETIRDDRSRGQCDDNDGVGCRDSKEVTSILVELGDCWCHSLSRKYQKKADHLGLHRLSLKYHNVKQTF